MKKGKRNVLFHVQPFTFFMICQKERKIMLRSIDFDRFDVILDELRDVLPTLRGELDFVPMDSFEFSRTSVVHPSFWTHCINVS